MECEAGNGLLLLVRGDVGHEREVLDEAASLAFGCVRGAQHSKLRGLQRTGTRDLASLFKLRRDARHHAQCRDERQARQDLRDPSTLHLEALDRPVSSCPTGVNTNRTSQALKLPGRDGVDEAVRDRVLLQLEQTGDIQLLDAIWLGEDLVNALLELGVELFEQVLKQQRKELTGPVFHPLKRGEKNRNHMKRTTQGACCHSSRDRRLRWDRASP